MPKLTRFNEDEYAILVLQGVKRMLKRSDYFIGFVPPRDVMRDSATAEEATQAIQHAINTLRDNLSISALDRGQERE